MMNSQMVEKRYCLLAMHTGLNSLVPDIKCMLPENSSNLSESCSSDFSLRGIIKVESLSYFFTVWSELLSTHTFSVLVFRDLSLNKRNIIIEVPFHSILSHCMLLLSDIIISSNIMRCLSKSSSLNSHPWALNHRPESECFHQHF